MELNEKLAARRRELAIEAEKAKQIERDAINAEVTKRLKQQGIAQAKPADIPKSTVDAEVEEVLNKAASARITSDENATFAVLLVLGLLTFFISWWLGAIFIVWAVMYISKKTARYKEQIVAEGKLRIEIEQKEASGKVIKQNAAS
jgi:hypothetical protein